MMPDTARKSLADEPCTCELCHVCRGRGRIDNKRWVNDDDETCWECGGSGIEDICDRCALLDEIDQV